MKIVKTTIEISDGLLDEAKARAAATNTSLRALVEQGLRSVLSEPVAHEPYRMADASVGGEGLAEGVGWDDLLDYAYDEPRS